MILFLITFSIQELLLLFSNEICFIYFLAFISVLILHTSLLQDFITVSDFLFILFDFFYCRNLSYGRLAESYTHVSSEIISLIAYDKGSHSGISCRSTLNDFPFSLTLFLLLFSFHHYYVHVTIGLYHLVKFGYK